MVLPGETYTSFGAPPPPRLHPHPRRESVSGEIKVKRGPLLQLRDAQCERADLRGLKLTGADWSFLSW